MTKQKKERKKRTLIIWLLILSLLTGVVLIYKNNRPHNNQKISNKSQEPRAKSQDKPKPKPETRDQKISNKSQEPRVKSQDKPKPKPETRDQKISNKSQEPRAKSQDKPKLETRNPKPETRNQQLSNKSQESRVKSQDKPKLETRNQKPETRNQKLPNKTQEPRTKSQDKPKLETRNPKPETRNPIPDTGKQNWYVNYTNKRGKGEPKNNVANINNNTVIINPAVTTPVPIGNTLPINNVLNKNIALPQAVIKSNATITVKGIVTDAANGKPLTGVLVKVKGTLMGTTTNISGMYQLQVPDTMPTLVVQYAGYKNAYILPEQYSKTVANTNADAQYLFDIANYQPSHKNDITGSVSLVKITNQNYTQLINKLNNIKSLIIDNNLSNAVTELNNLLQNNTTITENMRNAIKRIVKAVQKPNQRKALLLLNKLEREIEITGY